MEPKVPAFGRFTEPSLLILVDVADILIGALDAQVRLRWARLWRSAGRGLRPSNSPPD